MAFPQKYDPTDAADILRYAKWLIGKTFYDVLKEDLSYSKLFKDKSYSVEEEIWKYYFGRGV